VPGLSGVKRELNRPVQSTMRWITLWTLAWGKSPNWE
jgi:hypothetical protein